MLYKSECSTVEKPVIPKNSKVIGMHRVAHYFPVLYISAINSGGRITKQYKLIARSVVTGRYYTIVQILDAAVSWQKDYEETIIKNMWLEFAEVVYESND